MQRLNNVIGSAPPAVLSAAWLAAVVLAGAVTWAGFSAWRAGDELRDRAGQVAELIKADPSGGDADGPAVKAAPAVARVAQRHFLSAAPPQAFRQAQGVLGDRVLYPGGQSFAVGDNAMGATVKKIDVTHVELEFEGETIRVEFGSGGGGGVSPPGARFRRGMRRGGRNRR